MDSQELLVDILLVTGAGFIGRYIAHSLRLPAVIGFPAAGAAEAVDAEFEAAQEFVRHVLHRFGVSAREIGAVHAVRRAEHYREE